MSIREGTSDMATTWSLSSQPLSGDDLKSDIGEQGISRLVLVPILLVEIHLRSKNSISMLADAVDSDQDNSLLAWNLVRTQVNLDWGWVQV